MNGVAEAIEAVWRNESARLVAGIAHVTRDIGIAEELAQDALVSALEQWPEQGIPENPGAWLMKAAKWRALDSLRRAQNLAPKHEEITRDLKAHQQRLGQEMEQSFDQVIDDDILRLLFTACHPVLAIEGRIALTLRILGGLTTTEIARAFLVPEKTMGQRITRAKKALTDAHVPFETPRGRELHERVESVLLVIYLIFNEGYTATSGQEWSRAPLVEEALRLARTLVKLIPKESEAHALLALMELNASRAAARRGVNGEAVLLPDQDRTLWDRDQIQRGLAALDQAQKLGGSAEPYALQAAITACHARAMKVEDTDWRRIVALYDVLLKIKPSPIVALNRAVGIGMAHGLEAGLAAVDAIDGLSNYHLRSSVRGDLLMKLGRNAEAEEELQRAIFLTDNLREKQLLAEKLNQIENITELKIGPPAPPKADGSDRAT
jgi:RNA polymerase sigma factor (sigma-70 family)